jgi:RNA polymerase sigma-70 factor (ECF subfamily)
MVPSDNQLISDVRAGHNGSFAVLVERYQTPIYNLMYRFSGSSEEAADMTQELFIRAYEHLGTYREPKGFFPWLYTMALNHARDWHRKRHNRRRLFGIFAADEPQGPRSPDHECETRERLGDLGRALNRLPEDRRELLILRYRHDCSIRDLADMFDISESAVKMRLQRSLELVGRTMEGFGHD